MEIKTNITWRDYQRDTIKEILNNDKGMIHVIKSPRQCGKTTVAESILLYYAVNYNDSFSMFLSPTIKQARKVFLELKKAIEKTPIYNKANESTLEMTFFNNSKIIFCSAEQGITALQGYTVNKGILIIDEAAFIQDDIFYALFPICDAHSAPIILTSTPRLKDGLFYDYFESGLIHEANIISYDWAGQTLLTPEKLAFYKSKLPDNVFRNYYLGEFTDFGDGVFGDFTACVNDNYNSNINQYVIGIDWSSGTGSDETSITVFNENAEMVYIEGFNDLDETQTINKVAEIVKRFNPRKVQVETNSIGQIFFGLLRKALPGYNVQGFNTSNDSKQELVQQFQVAIQNNEVSILNDKILLSELNNFESKLTPSGKITYAAAKNGHDDRVMSTLIAFNALKRGSYCIA